MKGLLLILILIAIWIAGFSIERRIDKIIDELAEIKNAIEQRENLKH